VDEPTSLAEDLLRAVVLRLISKGVMDAGDLLAISEEFAAKAHAASDEDDCYRFEMLADTANAIILEAEAPTESEWKAEQARARFRLIEGSPDGGNVT
jgi:hypothetical protein